MKLDRTQDLGRMARIYGTAKPEVGIPSRFYGGERVEDEALRDYLLTLELPQPQISTLVMKQLPDWFKGLLRQDEKLRDLWSGNGKPATTDTSRSGFDYSIARRLLWLGHRNIDDLATILALRPNGSVRQSGKSAQYIMRTIGSALMR